MFEKIAKTIWTIVGLSIIGLSLIIGNHYIYVTQAMKANSTAAEQVKGAQQQLTIVSAMINELKALEDDKVDDVLLKYTATAK